MKIRMSVQLLAALALLTGLMLSTTAQAGATGKVNVLEKKKHSGKNSGKKEGPGKVGATAPPECASGRSECRVDVTLRQGAPTTGASCSSFSSGEGFCVGSSIGTATWSQPGYFPRQGIGSSFTWKGPGGARDVDYTVTANALITDAYIRGNVPGPGSATFNVTDAYNRESDIHWKTASSGGAPGTVGGPLYLNYSYDFVGSYAHIYGYLVPK